MIDTPSTIAVTICAIVLLSLLAGFMTVKVKQSYRAYMHQRIVAMLKQTLPRVTDTHVSFECRLMNKLARIYWRHPEWVAAGFTELCQAIPSTDKEQFENYCRMNAAFYGMVDSPPPVKPTTARTS